MKTFILVTFLNLSHIPGVFPEHHNRIITVLGKRSTGASVIDHTNWVLA